MMCRRKLLLAWLIGIGMWSSLSANPSFELKKVGNFAKSLDCRWHNDSKSVFTSNGKVIFSDQECTQDLKCVLWKIKIKSDKKYVELT